MSRPSPKSRPARLAFFASMLLLSPGASQGQDEQKKLSNKEIYLYQGADREQRLVKNAKSEEVLSLYTSLALKDAVSMTEAFQEKYGIKVNYWRAGAEKVVQRALLEDKAGRYAVDAFAMDGPKLEILYRENLLEEFHSPFVKDIPPAALPAHKYYAPYGFNFFLTAYNTGLVKPADVPKTYEDLLDPKWTGKIGLESGDVDWFAAVVKGMGEERGLAYFRKLAAMKPQMRTGHTLVAEMVSSGEIALTPAVYNHMVDRLKNKGAPIEWKALSPLFGRPSSVGVAKNAPHPHAALLFCDFILSTEGQEIIKQSGRAPASTAVENPLKKLDYQPIDPAIVVDEWDKWEKIWSRLFLGGKTPEKTD